jgi:hypothetical protein
VSSGRNGVEGAERALDETMEIAPHPRGWRGGGEIFHYSISTLLDICAYIIFKSPYVGMEYMHDPKMVLPLGDAWSSMGVYFM